jgi:NAD(P)-dependent dehydrogenase (short-subunit alcohol dehydrogenase family)
MARYLISGATRGIGRSLVDRLSGEHELILLGRTAAVLAELPGQPVVVDLAQPEGLAAALPDLDSLDGLIHCAGVLELGSISDLSVKAWQDQLTVNLIAAVELTRLLLPPLRTSRGSVIFVNSTSGQYAAPTWSAYAASKFGLRAAADSLRAEEPRLRVSTVYPGRTATEMQRAVREFEEAAWEPESYSQPETVAGVIAQLLATPSDSVISDVTVVPRSV